MIKLQPEVVLTIGNLKITNTLLTSWLIVLILVIFFITRKYYLKPSKIQLILETLYENLYKFWTEITHLKSITLFSFCSAFFIYIAFANLIILIPIFEALYVKTDLNHHQHLFRSVFSDFNMTLALAIISVLVTNFLGFISHGQKFIKKFLSPLGILELISEFAKIISFSFRLFGNIFAGKVLLVVISMLIIYLVPAFFISLETFVGFIQALVFFVLTSVFIKVVLEH
jgi:F-type H+-transporting ATPase subunit a